MPQLNPLPWFAIFVFSWFVFLAIVVPKVQNHTFLNEPVLPDAQASKSNIWTWPW